MRRWLRRAERFHHELFVAKWRSGLEREARRQEELLLALVYLEALGIESPASATTLELYPELLASFHRWHRHAGLDTFPSPGVCC